LRKNNKKNKKKKKKKEEERRRKKKNEEVDGVTVGRFNLKERQCTFYYYSTIY
jgi:hypothetical protein